MDSVRGIKLFKEHAVYWSDKVDSDEHYNYYIIFNKEKDLPYSWKVLVKKEYNSFQGARFKTLDEAKNNLNKFRAKLIAEKI